jgi:chromosome segregation ATPase
MGVYINHNNHEDIFKNKADLKAPNQGFFVKNHTAEMIEAQQKINASMEKMIAGLGKYQKQQDGQQQKKWLEVEEYLQWLLKMNTRHEQVEERIKEQLFSLEKNDNKLSDALTEKIAHGNEKMELMHASQQELSVQLKQYETEVQKLIEKMDDQAVLYEQLIGKVNDQTEVQQRLSEKVNEQENNQENVMSRLDNQEALTEKLLRQFEHLRSSLFERTAFLAEKVEESAAVTSNYMTKLLSGKDRSKELSK